MDKEVFVVVECVDKQCAFETAAKIMRTKVEGVYLEEVPEAVNVRGKNVVIRVVDRSFARELQRKLQKELEIPEAVTVKERIMYTKSSKLPRAVRYV